VRGLRDKQHTAEQSDELAPPQMCHGRPSH
jgi:hypothetical protein